MATLYSPTWYTGRPGPLPAMPAGRRPHLSNGATSTPSGFLPALPDSLGHPTSTRLRRPGLGRRGFANTLLRASMTVNKAFSSRGLTATVLPWVVGARGLVQEQAMHHALEYLEVQKTFWRPILENPKQFRRLFLPWLSCTESDSRHLHLSNLPLHLSHHRQSFVLELLEYHYSHTF